VWFLTPSWHFLCATSAWRLLHFTLQRSHWYGRSEVCVTICFFSEYIFGYTFWHTVQRNSFRDVCRFMWISKAYWFSHLSLHTEHGKSPLTNWNVSPEAKLRTFCISISAFVMSSCFMAVLSGIPTRMTPSGMHLERWQIYYNGVPHFVINYVKMLQRVIHLPIFTQVQSTLKL
jgi:hypothetical protein